MLFVVIEGRYEDCVKHMVGLITLLCKSEQLHDSSVLFPDDYFMNHYASEFNQDGRHRLMDLDFISYGNRVDSQRKSKVKSMFVVKYFSYDRQEYRIHNCDPYTGKTNDPTIIFHLGDPSPSFLTFMEQNQFTYQIIPIIIPKRKKNKKEDEKEEEEEEEEEEEDEEEEKKFVPPSILMHAKLQTYLTSSSSSSSSSFRKWTVEEALV